MNRREILKAIILGSLSATVPVYLPRVIVAETAKGAHWFRVTWGGDEPTKTYIGEPGDWVETPHQSLGCSGEIDVTYQMDIRADCPDGGRLMSKFEEKKGRSYMFIVTADGSIQLSTP